MNQADQPASRILLITRNLPPLVGGMERLNWHMADELAKVAEVRVIGPAGSGSLAPAKVSVHEAPLNPLWKFLIRASALAIREAKTWKPDAVLAGSGLTAPIALRAAHRCGARVVVYVHGLDIAARHPLYRAVWLPAIRRMDHVIANSSATAALAGKIGVKTARISIVHPGVEIPQNLANAQASVNFRDKHSLGKRPLLLSVGRLNARKGLREFITHALPRIVAARPEVIMLIAGDAPSDALHAHAQSPEIIRAAAKQAGVADNVRFLGRLTDSQLSIVYCAANVHVFPVREIPGDMEGFGMVATEAAAHGLPTVAFATGGVVDAVAHGQSGYLVSPGDYQALADAVLRTLAAPEVMHASCIAFAERFAWPEFGTQIAARLPSLQRSSVIGNAPS